MSKLRIRIELDSYDQLDLTIKDVDQSVVDVLISDTLYNLQKAKSIQIHQPTESEEVEKCR